MYKYSRERLAKLFFNYEDKRDFLEDLLAQKEDRKEIECVYQLPKRLGGKQLKWKLKSPSPLEIEEIEEIDWVATIISKKKLARSINKLISNQKKLYQYIKEKK